MLKKYINKFFLKFYLTYDKFVNFMLKFTKIDFKRTKMSNTKLMTIILDEQNADPKACLTATDDAVGLSKDEMLAWLGLRPVIFINGKVEGELDANDYAKYKNTALAADITTLGNDVMVEFPQRAWRIFKKDGKIYFQVTDKLNTKGFIKNAWIDESGVLKDNFYIGTYDGVISDGKLYSSSGKNPTTDTTVTIFRNAANVRGEGYCLLGWYQWLYFQLTYLLVHQNLNSQAEIGKGRMDAGDTKAYRASASGILNKSGVHWGDQTGINCVKCNYIENPWGNVWNYVDKIFCNANFDLLITTGKPNATGEGYKNFGREGKGVECSGFISKIMGTSELGFYPRLCDGSPSEYFCDIFLQAASTIPICGSAWAGRQNAGVFALNAHCSVLSSRINIGARLGYV